MKFFIAHSGGKILQEEVAFLKSRDLKNTIFRHSFIFLLSYSSSSFLLSPLYHPPTMYHKYRRSRSPVDNDDGRRKQWK
jgi:hypothetical protein